MRASGETVLLGQGIGFIQQANRDAEGVVALLRSGNGLEDEANGRTRPQALHLRGDMGQDTILCWDVPRLYHVVGHVEQASDGVIGIIDRVDADDGVATTVGQPFVDSSADAGGRVRRVVRLVTAREGARGTNGVGTVGRARYLFGAIYQVQVGHEFSDRGNYFSRKAGADAVDHRASGG